MIKPGDRLPETLGTDQWGKPIKSSDFKGKKLILYTYPRANTPGCTAEACSLQQHKDTLAAKGYSIVGISRDSQSSQLKFTEKYGLDFPLIADVDTTLLQTLGCWGEKVFCGKKSIGILRTTFLVNEEGIVEHVFMSKQIKTKIHAEQILDWLESSQNRR